MAAPERSGRRPAPSSFTRAREYQIFRLIASGWPLSGWRRDVRVRDLLTMIVSLEAIFLSTFVMISQNRADAKRQVVANLQWRTVQEKDSRTTSA